MAGLAVKVALTQNNANVISIVALYATDVSTPIVTAVATAPNKANKKENNANMGLDFLYLNN